MHQSVSRRFLGSYKLQKQTLPTYVRSITTRYYSAEVMEHTAVSNTGTHNDEDYKMILRNSTDQPWHFGIYQKQPSSPGLTSVAWQVRGLPPMVGEVPPSAEVNWALEYGVCIADFDEDERKFTGIQFAPAHLGNNYKIVSLDGIPSISTTPTGTGNADQIILKNSTGPPATKLSVGFTLSNKVVVVENDVGGLQKTLFRVHPTYYIACYRNIVPGQLVDEGVVIGPIEVRYDAGFHVAVVEAFKDSTGNYQMKAKVVPSAM